MDIPGAKTAGAASSLEGRFESRDDAARG